MKIPATWITLSLTPGCAFAAAFFIARRDALNSAGKSHAVAVIGAAAAGREAAALAGQLKDHTSATPPSGVLLDTRLSEALAMPDLAAAFKHIMAHEGEDYCAGTRLLCLIEQLPAARLTELPAALAVHMGNDYIVRFVLSAWAQRDSAGALAWVQATPAPGAAGVRAFLSGWTRAAPEAALAWLEAQPLSTRSGALRTAIVEALAETNPAAALTVMKERGWITNSPTALVKLLRNWGGADPQAALAGLRAVRAGLDLTLAGDGDKPPTGLASNNKTFSLLLRALLLGAYERNPADAAALFASFQPDERLAGSEAFAQEVLARDPAAGEALFTAHPDDFTRTLLLSVAERNPSLALSCLARIADPNLRQEIVRCATSDHDKTRPALAAPESQSAVSEALAGMEPGGSRDQATARICLANAASAPHWAVELWRSLPAEQRLDSGIDFFSKVAASSPDLALTEYRDSSPALQATVLRTLSRSLAATRPAETMQLVLDSTAEETKALSAAILFSFWAKSDQPSALAALTQHAARLDLAALEKELKYADAQPIPFGYSTQRVDTSPIAARIRELRAAHPTPSP